MQKTARLESFHARVHLASYSRPEQSLNLFKFWINFECRSFTLKSEEEDLVSKVWRNAHSAEKCRLEF